MGRLIWLRPGSSRKEEGPGSSRALINLECVDLMSGWRSGWSRRCGRCHWVRAHSVMLVVLGRWAFVMLGRNTLSVLSRRSFAGLMCCSFGSSHVVVVMAVVRQGRCAADQAQGQACRDNVFHGDFP